LYFGITLTLADIYLNGIFGTTEHYSSESVNLLVLTRLLQGTLYIEGDGTFFTADQALENARTIDSIL